ncbi:MAG: hypothetical protein ACKVWV_16050 [Planctomycetota bacterium]
MSRLAVTLLLGVTLLAAWLRLEAGVAGRPTEVEARALGAGWLVDDDATASHLRRVELALAGGTVPRADRFLSHPELGELAGLPLFDRLLAAGAQRTLSGTSADPALRRIDEGALEHWMSAVNLWLAAALVLATYWTARAFASSGPALAAAVFVAVFPPAVIVGAAGRLDAHVFAATCVALAAGCLARGLRAREALDGVFLAFIAGGAFGFASAISFSALSAFAVAWLACVLACARGLPELRAARLRTALCFCVVAALTAQLFLADVVNEGGAQRMLGSAARATSFVFMLGALPLLAASLTRGDLKRKPFHLVILVAGAGGLVYAARDTLREFWNARHPFAEQIAAHGWGSVISLLAVGIGLAIAAWFARRRPSRTGTIAVCGAFVVLAVSSWTAARAGPDHTQRVEIVRSLRWLRENAPSAGAWNSAVGTTDFGVLADPRAGALIAYHARRPAVCSDAVLGSVNEERVVPALHGTDVEALVRALRVLDARYVVVSPLYATAETPTEAFALRLSLADAPAIEGFERVYSSPLRLGVGGRAPRDGSPSGPAITIYRVTHKPSEGARGGGFAPR